MNKIMFNFKNKSAFNDNIQLGDLSMSINK